MFSSHLVVLLLNSLIQIYGKINNDNFSFQQCEFKKITYDQVFELQPWIQTTKQSNKEIDNDVMFGTKLDEVYDALQLSKCNASRMSSSDKGKEGNAWRGYKIRNDDIIRDSRNLRMHAKPKRSEMDIYVVPDDNNKNKEDGSIEYPFKSIHDAIMKIRNSRKNKSNKDDTMRIILRNGVHHIKSTLKFLRNEEFDDSKMIIMSYPGEYAWVSGGELISDLSWEHVANNTKIYKTSIPVSKELPDGIDISSMFGAGTGINHTRYTLARSPNMDVERDMWGIGYQNHSFYADTVQEWTLPSKSRHPPAYLLIDLSNSSNPTGYIKNNSFMDGYNTFTVGAGGSCSSIWDVADGIYKNADVISKSSSYWCSPYSAGGWAEVDAYSSTEGIPQIPNGMKWNMSHPDLQFLNDNDDSTNAVLHAWHSQTWAVHMFQIQSMNTSSSTMAFKQGSGSQGARNWCKCNQCNYAGALWTNSGREKNWCRDENDTRLIGGSWFIEGLFSSLDHPNEFFFNSTSRELYLVVNDTDSPPDSLIIPVLKELISISSYTHEKPISNILLDNIGFRDTVSTYKEKWEVPSGGDWSFHRSAALHIRNSTHTHVHNCTFRRLNGNAYLLSGYNRNSYLQRSTFEYIGQNAAAAYGYTNFYDGTLGLQPRYSYIQQNWFHDIGLFEKQSAAWFQAKSALNFIEQNVMFNLPRAAININDGFGGGNVIQQNVIFNTCRESGDHGNSK